MLWVIPILKFKMINHTSHNIALIDRWVSQRASNEFTTKTYQPRESPERITIDNKELIQPCVVCHLIPYFPIITDCSHLFCANCFTNLYKNHLVEENGFWIVKCPICRVTVDESKLRSGHQELVANPDSKFSKFFQNATINCLHGCSHNKHKILDYGVHQYFECERRVIKCPAKDCPTMTSAPLLQQHMKECPFMYIYCAKCLTGFRVGILVHDCALTLRQHYERMQFKGPPRLVGTIYPHIRHGDVILPAEQPLKDILESVQEYIQKTIIPRRWCFGGVDYDSNGRAIPDFEF